VSRRQTYFPRGSCNRKRAGRSPRALVFVSYHFSPREREVAEFTLSQYARRGGDADANRVSLRSGVLVLWGAQELISTTHFFFKAAPDSHPCQGARAAEQEEERIDFLVNFVGLSDPHGPGPHLTWPEKHLLFLSTLGGFIRV